MYKVPNISKYTKIYKNKVPEPFVGLKQGDILSTIFFYLFIHDLSSSLADSSNGNIEKLKLEDIKSSLLFGDDLAIFSLLQKELQNKINILEEHCYNCNLKLKLKETKIIIFNKHGANIKKFKFYYRDKENGIANQYTYLGFTFAPSGKKQIGIDNLITKARKVQFSIQKLLHKSKEKTIKKKNFF